MGTKTPTGPAEPGPLPSARTVHGGGPLRGAIRLPGDKSVAHRTALLGAIAEGESRIEGFPSSGDPLSTLRCLRGLGVTLRLSEADAVLTVRGAGLHGLTEPEDVLDCGNSGTTMRLLCGLLAGQPFRSVLSGDASLRSRPMARVLEPLRAMGAEASARSNGGAPLMIRGGALAGTTHRLPVASAQVKSALLLAGLYATGETIVSEPARSRDHTERMLRAMGADIAAEGTEVRIRGPVRALRPLTMRVPGDFSAATFWLVAGACVPGSELTITDVGMNPTRTGALDVLRAMGANIEVLAEREAGGEPVADLRVRGSSLRATEVGGALVPRLIDEIPVLALAATQAEGRTVFRDAGELRVKETDRIATTVGELRKLGADIEATADGMIVRGRPGGLGGGGSDSHGDHRLAMTLGVAALISGRPTTIDDADAASISYPSFWEQIDALAPIGAT
ncbi:MAG: 3-phosphoshikimate 1-carboxyvinyltransferase [Dehalococcoidia bacterium]|nr:3-phosphoshikimate 1-carboxyvinyltransferase [Dehalococcoidia bacterium]